MKEKNMFGKVFRHTGIRKYWVSEYGDVVNLTFPNRIMKDSISWDGHHRIELKIKKGVPKKFFIHRLVYQAFVGELVDGYVIEHLDGNPSNNHYTNLKQSTQADNLKRALHQHGTFGENNSKKITIQNIYTKEILQFDMIKDLFEYLDIPNSNGALSRIVNHSKFDDYIILEVK